MEDISRSVVVGLGELLWDCFGESRRPGGAPANVAFHADQLGARGVICSRVGPDELGNALLQHLREQDLEIDSIQRDPHHPTGTVTVEVDDKNEPHYIIHENVAWDYLAFDEQLARVASQASAVCFGTLAQRSKTSRHTIEAFLDPCEHALRVYDITIRPPWYDADMIDASLRRCDVAKLNQEEVPVVADAIGLSVKNPRGVADALLTMYELRVVCVTRGEAGCLAVSPDAHADVPGHPVEVADTVGSGDAFTAALVCGLLRGWPLERIARFANQVGALVATRPGAMPNLRDEFTALALAG